MQQIAVGAMKFDEVEAHAQRSLRRLDEGAPQTREIVSVRRLRRRPVGRERDRRRAERPPCLRIIGRQGFTAFGGGRGRSLSAGMAELNADLGEADALYDPGNMGERPLAVVGIEAGAARRDAADRFDAGGFDHHQCGTRGGEAADMLEVPVLRDALDSAVLAHRRHHDAIGQSQAAQADRPESDAAAPSRWLAPVSWASVGSVSGFHRDNSVRPLGGPSMAVHPPSTNSVLPLT